MDEFHNFSDCSAATSGTGFIAAAETGGDACRRRGCWRIYQTDCPQPDRRVTLVEGTRNVACRFIFIDRRRAVAGFHMERIACGEDGEERLRWCFASIAKFAGTRRRV